MNTNEKKSRLFFILAALLFVFALYSLVVYHFMSLRSYVSEIYYGIRGMNIFYFFLDLLIIFQCVFTIVYPVIRLKVLRKKKYKEKHFLYYIALGLVTLIAFWTDVIGNGWRDVWTMLSLLFFLSYSIMIFLWDWFFNKTIDDEQSQSLSPTAQKDMKKTRLFISLGSLVFLLSLYDLIIYHFAELKRAESITIVTTVLMIILFIVALLYPICRITVWKNIKYKQNFYCAYIPFEAILILVMVFDLISHVSFRFDPMMAVSIVFQLSHPVMLFLADWYYNKTVSEKPITKTKAQRIAELEEEVAKLKANDAESAIAEEAAHKD